MRNRRSSRNVSIKFMNDIASLENGCGSVSVVGWIIGCDDGAIPERSREARMANFTVVYDACLLYPASVRDLVVELARTGLLRAKWTARSHLEWINAVIRQRPELDRARLERVAALMDRHRQQPTG